MALVNIRRDVHDSFYRYKMPKIQSKIEGKGNGIKTVVPNMSDVSKALARTPFYLTKFFGFELGAQTTTNEKMDRYIINGAHDADKLQDLLDVFINRFVLCKECKNPETELVVSKKNGTVTRNCKACGQQTEIDPRQKLQGVIVKNPPKRTKKKGGDDLNGENGDGDYEDGQSDDELYKRINAEAAELPSADRSRLKAADWANDMSEEAIKARVKEVEAGLNKALVFDDDDEDANGEDDADNPYNQFGEWILSQNEPSDVDIFKKATDLGIEGRHHTLQVLAQTVFDDKIIANKEIEKRSALLTKMVTSERHEKALLGGIEAMIGNGGDAQAALIQAVPKVLHQLYENDIVSEEVITKWGSRASKKYTNKETSKKIRKASEPFLKWLEEAEEDTEEED